MMKKLYILLAICCSVSCSKIDDLSDVKGEIRYNGHVYPLKNAYRNVWKTGGQTLDGNAYYNYYHALYFTAANGEGINVLLTISAEDIELLSGELHLGLHSITADYKYVEMSMDLKDNFVHYARHSNPADKVLNLKYIKKGDIVEIELKYADIESDFLIKWEGPVKDWWTWASNL
jgi:hypothetical protein